MRSLCLMQLPSQFLPKTCAFRVAREKETSKYVQGNQTDGEYHRYYRLDILPYSSLPISAVWQDAMGTRFSQTK